MRKKAGNKEKYKPNGYWKDWKNVNIELEKLIEELGHFPTHKDFVETKNYNIYRPILRYHDGIGKVREKMGYVKTERERRPYRYWKKFENIEKELNNLAKKLGHFPSSKELYKLGYAGLIHAIYRDQQNLYDIKKSMGYENKKRSEDYWKDEKNIKKELEELIEKLGHFPFSKDFVKNGYRLYRNILNYHGGIDKVREKMGYETLNKKPSGYWKDINNVINELKEITMKLGHFPTKIELLEIGESSLDVSISKYHGGFDNVKLSMGYGTIRKRDQFISFLSRNKTARNLVHITINANGFRSDIEQIINEVYTGKFKDQETLHNLIDESTDEIYKLIQHGMTNLGYFIGGFTLQDRKIIPVLIGEAIDNIPEKRINASLEYRLVRLLRQNYSPEFNENPQRVIEELKVKIQDSKGKKRKLYERLSRHYTEVLELKEELT
ncbi:MAG TPA: hypothetical protein VJJ23_00235 [Candidatus Nanoarchaeia archaeon]|nr:hypothetical protein [Candidatus Nanoarchaeia archaeon]